ncbi:hypothetical protein, partial [Acinetobacter sp. UBA3025]|uniref:hypothetical protein n=1 Tax=Acinetobacter sp. UBA3025 TaxID=1945933 RepID=UPI0025C068E7
FFACAMCMPIINGRTESIRQDLYLQMNLLYVNSTYIAEPVLVFVYPPLSFTYSFELAIKKTP